MRFTTTSFTLRSRRRWLPAALTLLLAGPARGQNVGIGTPTPGARLDVNGNIFGTDILVDRNATNTGSLVGGLRFGVSNSGEGIASQRTGTGNLSGLDIYTLYQKRISITQSGNVGIGIPIPTQKLDVNGNTYLRGTAQFGTSDGDKLFLTALGANGSKLGHAPGWGVVAYAGPGNVSPATGYHGWLVTSGGAFTERMRLTFDGLGLGTTTPHHLLDLGASLGTSPADAAGKKLAVYNNAAGTDFYGFGISSGALQLFAGATPTEGPNVTLLSNGNVGIANETPSQKLDVNGYLRVAGAANAPATGAVPAVAFLTLTATMPAAAASVVAVPHGLTDAKIISLQVLVETANGNTTPPAMPENNTELYYAWLNANRVMLRTANGASSSSVLGRPVRILLTYQP